MIIIKSQLKENINILFSLIITLVISLVLHPIEVIHYEGTPEILSSV